MFYIKNVQNPGNLKFSMAKSMQCNSLKIYQLIENTFAYLGPSVQLMYICTYINSPFLVKKIIIVQWDIGVRILAYVI